MTKIGVTGTRHGLTWQQLTVVTRHLQLRIANAPDWQGSELHHGDCVGVDVQVAAIAAGLGYRTVMHPPTDNRLRAYHDSDDELPPRHYLDRNREIVDSTSVLLVCPDIPEEQQRSGTWSTYRYARRRPGRMVVLILPNGEHSTFLDTGAAA